MYRYIKKKNECKYQILIWFITIFNLLCSIYNWPIRNNRWWRLLSLWNYINEEKLQNEDNCLWYLNSHLIYGKAEVLEFCPKSPMLDFMVNHSYFFIFMTWISLIIIGILGGIHENVVRKNWNFGGIHGRQKKKIETTWCPGWALRPPLRPSAETEARGPSLGTRWFQFILFLPSMKPPKFQFFCPHFRETTQNSNNNLWNQVTKKKKWVVSY